MRPGGWGTESESDRGSLRAPGQKVLEQRPRRIGRLQSRLWQEMLTGIVVRRGTTADIPAIRRIQMSSHTASHWEPETYFDFDVTIAERSGEPCGFLVSRDLAGEIEVLNLASAPDIRRQGVATALLGSIEAPEIFLEVRESNTVARKLYEKLGFTIVGTRPEYYDDPVETAIVMRLSRPAST